MSGMQMGPKTGMLTDFTSFEQVQEAFRTQVQYFVDLMVCSLNCTEKLIGDYCPHIFSSLLLEGCMEHGRDCTRGGAKYNHIGIQGVGMADVADSLTVLKKLVFDEPRISKAEMLEAMRTNFEGKEVLRQICLNRVPKYGNDIDEADEMAVWTARLYCDCVREKLRSAAAPSVGTFLPCPPIPPWDARYAPFPADARQAPLWGTAASRPSTAWIPTAPRRPRAPWRRFRRPWPSMASTAI